MKKGKSVTLRRRANYFVQYQVEFIDVHNRHICRSKTSRASDGLKNVSRVYSVRVPVSLAFFIVMALVFPPFLSLNPLHLFAIRVNFCYGYLQE